MNSYISAVIGGISLVAPAASFAAPKAPNVIYVFPDQMRNHAMAFWGQEGFSDKVNFTPDPVRTPNLDRFARESMVLTSAQSNFPLSSPHRGCLLTGLYPNGSGIPLNCVADRPISDLRDDIDCIGDVFSGAGYDCAYIGKLHAHHPTPNDPENPGHYVEDRVPAWDAYTEPSRRHGFNYWYSYGTFDEHKNPHYWDNEGRRHEPHEWSPIHEAGKAVEYIRNRNGQRDPAKPFFLMVSMNPPHSPYRSLDDCMEEDYNLYRNMPLDSLLVRPNADRKRRKAESAAFYFASVTGVDRAFGSILDVLSELGLDRNTIVVFASDHGETMCSHNTDDPKNSPYAESMNTPFIVRYPGHVRPAVDDLIISSPDIMPTLLGLAGLHDRIPANVQGYDYSSVFLGDGKSVTRPDGALYFQNLNGRRDADGNVVSYFANARGFKTKDYTIALYVDRKTGRLQRSLLFHDSADPYQLDNLPLEENEAIVRDLCTRMGRELRRIGDPWYTDRILADMIPYGD